MISVGAPSVGTGKLLSVTRDICGDDRNIDALEGLVKLVRAVMVYFEQDDRRSLVVQVERGMRVICNSAMSTTTSEEDKLGEVCYRLKKTIQARLVSFTGATMATLDWRVAEDNSCPAISGPIPTLLHQRSPLSSQFHLLVKCVR